MIISFQKFFAVTVFFLLRIDFVIGQTVTIDNLALTATSGLTMTVSGDFRNQNGGTIDNAGIITVSGNWINNAANNVFTTNSGTVQMIGTSAQTIGGTSSTSFYNLTLNNTNASTTRYTLGKDQTVKSTLTLTVGQLDLSTYTMTIGNSIASTGTLIYTSGWLYGGTLKRWLGTSTIADSASAGFFPIGSSTNYRPIYLSAPVIAPSVGGTVSVSHTNIAGNTAVSFTDINVIIDRMCNPYWTIAPATGLSGGIYNLRIDGTGFTGITDFTQLRLIITGSSVGTNGINSGSNSNPQVNRTGLTVTDLTNNFHFGYPASAALPIELISFTAIPFFSDVRVNWITASETNTDYFIIERSPDGSVYEEVARVQGAGNSSNNSYYTTDDFNPLPGMSFYRLVEIDLDGSIVYFQPVSVRLFNTNNEFEITATHSTNEQVKLTIYSSVEENFVLDFYDSIGKLIFHQTGKLTVGYQDISIPLANKAMGIYMITVRTSSRIISKKVI